MVKKVVVELDLTELDEDIELDQIQDILVTYYNTGEGRYWTEYVPFKILYFKNEINIENRE